MLTNAPSTGLFLWRIVVIGASVFALLTGAIGKVQQAEKKIGYYRNTRVSVGDVVIKRV
jgi:hypothetical protein